MSYCYVCVFVLVCPLNNCVINVIINKYIFLINIYLYLQTNKDQLSKMAANLKI